MTIYTIVAYRPSGYDRRWENYYESESDLQIFEDADDAARELLRYKVLAKERKEYTDDDWEVKLLIDGRDYDYWCGDFWGKEESPFGPVKDKADALFEEWLGKAKEREEAARLEKEVQQKRAEAVALRAKIAQDKKLLAELKVKYPDA